MAGEVIWVPGIASVLPGHAGFMKESETNMEIISQAPARTLAITPHPDDC